MTITFFILTALVPCALIACVIIGMLQARAHGDWVSAGPVMKGFVILVAPFAVLIGLAAGFVMVAYVKLSRSRIFRRGA